MMFHADITFVLALIALASGALLLLTAKAHTDAIGTTCKVIGIIIAIIAILMMLCSGHSMFRRHMLKQAVMYNMIYQRKMMPRIMRRKMMQPYMHKKMRNIKTMQTTLPKKQ